MLDAAGEAQLAVGIHMQIDKLDLGILDILEEIVKVVVDRFGSGELARRRDVVDRHLVARVITFRHQLVGTGCRDALMLRSVISAFASAAYALAPKLQARMAAAVSVPAHRLNFRMLVPPFAVQDSPA